MPRLLTGVKKNFKKFFNKSQLSATCINQTEKILLMIGRDAFLFILIFILLELALGEFLFYRYVLLTEIQDPPMSNAPVIFKKSTYETVVKEQTAREKVLETALSGDYPYPFR